MKTLKTKQENENSHSVQEIKSAVVLNLRQPQHILSITMCTHSFRC